MLIMRKNLFFFLMFVCGTACSQQKQFKVACIGFYNLENLFDTIDQPDVNDEEFTPGGSNHYTADIYNDKLSKLDKVLSDLGKDESPDGVALLGVAEVENITVLQDLVKQPGIKDRELQIVHHDSPDERGIDVGLLYNPKYFKVKRSEKLFVALMNADSTPRYTRDILYVTGLLDGEPLHVFVNHWPSRRGGETASAPGRATAAKVARAKIDSILSMNPAGKVLLMGDLNDDPVSASITDVLKATGDAKKTVEGMLFNPWLEFYRKGTGTLAYNDAWNLFDQIIVSPSFLNKAQNGFYLKEAKIYKKEFMVNQSGRYKGYPKRAFEYNKYAGGFSDHFPTYIVLLKEAK